MFKFFNVLKANTEINNLNAQVTDLVAHNEQLKKEVEDLKQREATYSLGSQDWATEKENLIKGHEEALQALEEKHNKEINDFKNTVKEEHTSAVQKASEIVASLGVEPETVKLTKEDLVGKSEKKSRFTITNFGK